MLNLKRPLLFFDLETTGIDTVKDKIIDLHILIVYPDKEILRHSFRFNPGIPIPAEAIAIHGITNDDVKNCPLFSDKAEILYNLFQGNDVAGYNSNFFDVPMLAEHFLRSIKKLPFDSNTKFIDVCTIFKKKEERTLSAAVKFFLQEEHTNAHSAGADVMATYRVLIAQIDRYGDIGTDTESLANFSQNGKTNVDYAGKLVFNEKAEVCYNIGKARGTRVVDDPGFGQWMLKENFPLETKMHIEKLLNGL